MRLSNADLSKYAANGFARRMEEAIENPAKALDHPFYGEFVNKFREKLNIPVDQAEGLWKQLLQAYGIQGKRVPDIRKNNTIKTIRDYLAAINGNEGFRSWVKGVCNLCNNALKVPGDTSLALWTGGYKVSEIAQKLGLCTLEKTLLGDILNGLPVTVNWDQEEALWNILSAEFVSQYQGNTAHIYFRNVDEFCVLFQQEIPMLQKKNPPIEVVWHPLFNSGTEISEVGFVRESTGQMEPDGTRQIKTIAINIDGKNHVFFCRSNQLDKYNMPFEELAEQIHTASPAANKFTLTHFRSEKFHPVHAPYAEDSEKFVGWFVNDFVQKFWDK